MSLVITEKSGAIANLKLNRPEKLNAINGDMLDELIAALDSAEQDDDIRVLVLSGEGRAFSAGFDLEPGKPDDGESQEEYLRRELETDFNAIMRFWDCPKPVIAAVQGYCLGSSLEIAAVCDITIATEDALFGEPEVTFGSGIVCLILPWIVGQKNARELLLVGSKNISASRAAAMGLVNRVVPAEQLMSEVMAVAEQLAANDANAVRLTKQAIRMSAEATGMRQALAAALEIDIQIETGECQAK